MTRHSVQTQLTDLVQKLLHIPPEAFYNSYDKEPLTGPHFQLSAIDMTYLFFEIEKRFDVRFEEQDVINYRFNTIAQIAETIAQKKAS